MPKSNPVNSETTAVKARTHGSNLIGAPCGMLSPAILGKSPTAANATITPSKPPARERRTLSVRSCRITRPRLAPIAVRMATSLPREAARASKRSVSYTHLDVYKRQRRGRPPRMRRIRSRGGIAKRAKSAGRQREPISSSAQTHNCGLCRKCTEARTRTKSSFRTSLRPGPK